MMVNEKRNQPIENVRAVQCDQEIGVEKSLIIQCDQMMMTKSIEVIQCDAGEVNEACR